jgi:hypothetical protein
MWNDNKILGIFKRWHPTNPHPTFAKNHNMENIVEKGKSWQNKWMGGMAMGECKDKQKKSCITQTDCKHFQRGHGRLQSDNVYTWHGFLQITCEFGDFNSRTFFHNLFTERFVDKEFGNPCYNKIHKNPKMIICNFKQVNLGAIIKKKQIVKTSSELSNDKVGPKTTRLVR